MSFTPTQLLRVFLPFAAAYFLSYLFRVVNAVIAPDLVAYIGLNPSALGMLTSIYFISFACFQLPLGVLLDRYGPRRTEAALLLFAGVGALLFSRAETLVGLVTGRALIGFGVSSCLMAAFKAYTVWFPRDKWPLINGLQLASGGLGALAATSPVEAALHHTDWRGLFMALVILTLLAALAVFLIVPEKKGAAGGESLALQLRGIREIFTSARFWRIAPLTTATQASFLSIQGLWAGPWLRDVAGLDREAAASALFWIAAAMVTGYIVTGSLAERLSRRGIPIMTTSLAGIALFLSVQVLIISQILPGTRLLWLCFGFFGTSSILTYAVLTQAFPVHLAGRVNTAVNLLVFVATFAGQWAIGAIINLWPTGPGGSFAPSGFRAGFLLMLLLQLSAMAWYAAARTFAGDNPGEG